MTKKLVGNQSLLDKNDDGKISGEDFAELRKERRVKASRGTALRKTYDKAIKKMNEVIDKLEFVDDPAPDGGKASDFKSFIKKSIPSRLESYERYGYDLSNPSDLGEIIDDEIMALRKGDNGEVVTDKGYEILEKELPSQKFSTGGRLKASKGREPRQEGGAMEDMKMPPEMMGMEDNMPIDTYPNIPPEEMAEAEASQLPDAEMEENYLSFVFDQSLDDEEQDYLTKALEADPKLSQILDKVVITASEFSGAGKVEGPGTGVSDSIPARLSDGEFVFTKKATDQIGAGNLQRMMDDAERAFDGGMMRESKRMGGMMMKDEDPDLMEAMSNEDINRQMLMSNRAPSLLGTN